jgi:hypothetical protein
VAVELCCFLEQQRRILGGVLGEYDGHTFSLIIDPYLCGLYASATSGNVLLSKNKGRRTHSPPFRASSPIQIGNSCATGARCRGTSNRAPAAAEITKPAGVLPPEYLYYIAMRANWLSVRLITDSGSTLGIGG